MSKFQSFEAYILNELEIAQNKSRLYEDHVFDAAKEISSLTGKVSNQNLYIIELEEKLGIKGDV